jgi:hypothetical protein
MKSRMLGLVGAIILFAALANPVWPAVWPASYGGYQQAESAPSIETGTTNQANSDRPADRLGHDH